MISGASGVRSPVCEDLMMDKTEQLKGECDGIGYCCFTPEA